MSKKNVSLTIRLPQDLHATIEHIADIETRSINQQVLHFVKQGLEYRIGGCEKENEAIDE